MDDKLSLQNLMSYCNCI